MKNHHFKIPMASQIQSLIVEPNHRWIKITAILVPLLLIVLIGLNYFRIIDLKIPFLPTKVVQTATNQEPELPFTLDTCLVKKEGNPLIDSLSIREEGVQGVIKGMVEKVEKEPVRGSSIISLTSIDGKQKYDFNILNDPSLLVANLVTNKTASLSAIQTNQTLSLEFSCNKESNLFKFTKISILK